MTSSSPDLSVNLGGIHMPNPVMTASGTFGYGPEYANLIDLNKLGAIAVKGICLNGAPGNSTPRMIEVPGGLINAIGLQNPGVEKFINEYMPFLRKYTTPVIVNIWGKTIEEYALVAERLNDIEGISGLEVNISCPNVKDGGNAFGTTPAMAGRVTETVRKATSLPVIPKLPPNVPDIGALAKACEAAGANAISLINTFPAMVVDIETRKPVLANKIGGLSGQGIHPIAVKLVWDTRRAVKIPIVGIGGITSARDALEFLIAGASAVAIGTANFIDPETALKVIAGIRDYLIRKNIKSVGELVGSLDLT